MLFFVAIKTVSTWHYQVVKIAFVDFPDFQFRFIGEKKNTGNKNS